MLPVSLSNPLPFLGPIAVTSFTPKKSVYGKAIIRHNDDYMGSELIQRKLRHYIDFVPYSFLELFFALNGAELALRFGIKE